MSPGLILFEYTASILRIFLTSYQTDSPMMPIIPSDLYFVMKLLIDDAVLEEVLDRGVIPLNIDLFKNDIHLPLTTL